MSLKLGIDVGATGIKANIVDTKNGVCVKKRLRILTPPNPTPSDVLEVIQEIVAYFDWTYQPIGLCFPAIISKGYTKSAVNISQEWLNFNALGFLKSQLNADINLVNDADAAGLAELHFGAAKDIDGIVLLLTLGTGVGSALISDGRLIPNTEFGHLKWQDSIIEKYVSNSTRKNEDLSFKKWALALNDVLNHFDFILSPERIIIGGGVSKKFDKYEKFLMVPNCEVVPAILKNNAGIIGAACQIK